MVYLNLVKYQHFRLQAFSFILKLLVSFLELYYLILHELDSILVNLVEVFSRVNKSVDQILVNS